MLSSVLFIHSHSKAFIDAYSREVRRVQFVVWVKDELAGKLGKCPRCGEVFRVPAAAEDSQESTFSSIQSEPSSSTKGSSRGGDSGDPRTSRFKSAKRRSLPVWAWFAAGGLCALLAIVWASASSQPQTQVAKRQPQRPASAKTTRHGRFDDSHLPELTKPKPGASDEEMVKYVQHAIVMIDVHQDTWNLSQGQGSGFIIDKKNLLIATNYHVVSTAVKVDVLFHNGARFGVLGYMAVRPEYDLAILKLNGSPKQIAELQLHTRDDPDVQSQVFAIGHPKGFQFVVTRGHINAVLSTRQLPQDNQAWLKSNGRSDDCMWLLHSARIEPGNSGGPLINAQGEVLGVNSWLQRDEDGIKKFAIHARHLEETLKNLFPRPRPLADFRREPERPEQVEGSKLTLDVLKEAYKKAAATLWKPKSREQYGQLCDLAAIWTYTKMILGRDPREFSRTHKGGREEWETELDRILAIWKTVSWDEDHIKTVNTAAAFSDPGNLDGAFLFGVVQELVDGPRSSKLMKIGLIGSEEFVYVPVEDEKHALPKGAKCLVVGIVVGYKTNGDKFVPVVLAPKLLKLEMK